MERAMIYVKLFHMVPFIKAAIMCSGTFASTLLSYVLGYVSIYAPFISETGAFGVPKSFFTFFVICGGCVLGPLLFFVRYLAVRILINVENKTLQRINLMAMYFGFMSTVGLAGVIAFPVSSIFWTHMLSAVAHFFFAMVYVLLQTYLTFCTPQVSELMKKLRGYLCGLIIIFCFVLVILLPVSFALWNKENTHLPAVKKPADKGFGLMVTTACVEWTMYGCYLLYLVTFYSELLGLKLFVGMTPKEVAEQEDAT